MWRRILGLSQHRFRSLESIFNVKNSCQSFQQWSSTSNNGGGQLVYCPTGEKKERETTKKSQDRRQTTGCLISVVKEATKHGLLQMTINMVCVINACSSETPISRKYKI
ncbi:hypothetical protein CDAR_536781 [Caerostris darwini]|uniref:Uncharacterized protein n=1 Tax=Caerostris darwini TaxID=1538125 RepID=A0AAV4VIA3_9ARAC|nr:hypothetical protein CDAR_536781 [Caerostris darwini]